MSTYSNGYVPESLLVRFDDDPQHLLTPGTAAKLAALVALVQQRHGVTLRVTAGPNAYRWYQAQVDMRAEKCAIGRCEDAADPGTSSHGGSYQGADSMAVDIDNWAEIGQDAFYQACRDVGLAPGVISWEPWHVIDYNPWAVPAPASEGEDMPLSQQDLEQIAHYVWAHAINDGGAAADRLAGIDAKTEQKALSLALGEADIFGLPLSTRIRGIDDKTGSLSAEAIVAGVVSKMPAGSDAQAVAQAVVAALGKRLS